MAQDLDYTARERFWLWVLGAFGLIVANGAFLYGFLFMPDAMTTALNNPIALAFIVEALVLTAAFAYLFQRWQIGRISPFWFVVLSLLGSMAFAVPVALLWRRRNR